MDSCFIERTGRDHAARRILADKALSLKNYSIKNIEGVLTEAAPGSKSFAAKKATPRR